MPDRKTIAVPLALLLVTLTLAACGGGEPTDPARYQAPDQLFSTVVNNAAANPDMRLLREIDHSRLAAAEDVHMPPARVALISAPAVEAKLLKLDQRTAIDLPLRVLAYEDQSGAAAVIFNRYDFLVGRYSLPAGDPAGIAYASAIESLLADIPAASVQGFASDTIDSGGLVEIDSAYGFAETLTRTRAGIDSQDDAVWFGEVDYQAVAAEQGVLLPPTTLLLFGGPGPGGRAMAKGPTLGLDAFCQKILVWEDADGNVRISYNDLIDMARRQGVDVNLPLRVIQFRLNGLFQEAAGG